MLYIADWTLAAPDVVYDGRLIVSADSEEEAVAIVRKEIGEPEGRAANVRTMPVLGRTHWLRRRERVVEHEPKKVSILRPQLSVFEIVARANVVSSSEEGAFKRLQHAVRDRRADGRYVKLYRDKVIDQEPMGNLSDYERNMLQTGFITMVRG